MNLTKTLKKNGYDLISGPVRNHGLLQIWRKKNFDKIDMYHSELGHAFKSPVELKEVRNDAMSINASDKNEFKFNVGVTVLEETLESMGMANLDISSAIEKGKRVTISYDKSVTKEVPIGEIEEYFSAADFSHMNRILLDHANKDNLIIISGVLYAKDLVVEIETDFEITPKVKTKIEKIASANIDIAYESEKSLKMKAGSSRYFPVAVKAHRVLFMNGIFEGTRLITDNRNFF